MKQIAQKQNEELITKDYLSSEMGKLEERLEKCIVERVVGEMVTIKDEIVKEVKDMREEFNVHQFSHRRINGELEDHEDRISRLEKTTPSG